MYDRFEFATAKYLLGLVGIFWVLFCSCGILGFFFLVFVVFCLFVFLKLLQQREC